MKELCGMLRDDGSYEYYPYGGIERARGMGLYEGCSGVFDMLFAGERVDCVDEVVYAAIFEARWYRECRAYGHRCEGGVYLEFG